jgi:hypothetical protein
MKADIQEYVKKVVFVNLDVEPFVIAHQNDIERFVIAHQNDIQPFFHHHDERHISKILISYIPIALIMIIVSFLIATNIFKCSFKLVFYTFSDEIRPSMKRVFKRHRKNDNDCQ